MLAADVPACGDKATCAQADELSSEGTGVQFVQKRVSKRMQAVEDQSDEYDEIGDGSCLDITGSHGTDLLKYNITKDKPADCAKKCSKDLTCTGYDNRKEGCVYYKIAIVESNKGSSLYKCYKKVKAGGKSVQDVEESKKDAGVEASDVGCRLFQYNPAESLRSYSSVLKDDNGTGNTSMLHTNRSWRAAVDQPGQWMIMDMGKVTKIRGVVTQARSNREYESVKIFTCETSVDGKTWKPVEGKFIGSERLFPLDAMFPEPVQGRYLKIVVKQWNTHISMRAAAILCEDHETKMERVTMTKLPKDTDTCSWARVNPIEEARTYSSVYWDDKPGTGSAQSMLDSAQAWTAAESKEGEWMLMDLGAEMAVRGILTQARMDRPWESVKKFEVQYSVDGSEWTDEKEELKSSSEYVRVKEAKFSKLILARYIKLIVKSWRSKISMRAGAMVCAPTSSK